MPRMPLLFLATVLSLGVSLRAQQPPKPLPGPVRLYGPIESIREEQSTFTQRNGTFVEGPRVLQTMWRFSEDGTKQDLTYYLPDGRVRERTVHIYHPEGRPLEISHFNADNALVTREVYSYDDHKTLAGTITYRGDNSIAKRVTTAYNADRTQMQIETIEYDAYGAVIRQTQTTRTNQPRRIDSDSISLQSNGSATRSTISDTFKPDGTHDFQYQASNGQFDRQEVKLGEKGTFERLFYNRDGTILRRDHFVQEFDSYGNMIKSTNSSAPGDSQNYRPTTIAYRTITYYGKN